MSIVRLVQFGGTWKTWLAADSPTVEIAMQRQGDSDDDVSYNWSAMGIGDHINECEHWGIKTI